MKDSNYKPDGTGVVMGDRKAMPDRGTDTGMNPGADVANLGADLSQEATNRISGISGSTKSDPESTSFGGDDRV